MTKHEIYDAIKHQILVGYYKPGDPLNERELMDEYKIGKTPLREIFFRLQHDGLIRRLPRIGTIVSPIDTKKLFDVAEIRHHLEGMVAKLAVKRISNAALKEMGAVLQKMENAAKEGDLSNFLVEESHLHNMLYSAAGNLTLKDFIESQHNLFTRFWFSVNRTPIDLAEQLGDWQNTYQALCDKDEEKAAASNTKHFEKYFNHLRSL